MRTLVSFGIILVLSAFCTDSAGGEENPSPDQLRQRAEAAFEQGKKQRDNPDEARRHFRRAAQYYQQMAQRGCNNAGLYRNLGNAEYLADRLPHAILAWRKGLALNPGDADLRANLAYARKQVPYPPDQNVGPPMFLWPVGWPFPSTWQLFWSACGVWLLVCLAALRWWMVRRGHWLLLALASFFGCVILAGFMFVGEYLTINDVRYPAVVIAVDKEILYQGNGESYPPHPVLPTLYRGMEARLLFKRGDWLQIEFATGQVGWVPQSSVVTFPENVGVHTTTNMLKHEHQHSTPAHWPGAV